MNQELKIKKEGRFYTLPYELIKSKRKSVGIEVKPGGHIIVRIPAYLTGFQLHTILESRKEWIFMMYEKQKNATPIIVSSDPQTKYLEKQYRKVAEEYIAKRVEHYITQTGGSYKRITIRDQKTRWGSCSSNGGLSFNWRLMLAPPRVLDYVVVHELCHLTHMNHSRDFWNKVESIMPDYRVYRDWLKKNGSSLTLS